MFWLVLILQARTWIVLVFAGASRQQGNALLTLFYPDQQGFYPGLAFGLVAAVAFLLSGRRQQFPRLWAAWRWALVAAAVFTAVWQLQQFSYTLLQQSPVPLILLIFDLLSALWLLADRRLRDCFRTENMAGK
ncbi:DUF2919 domain-containing protein [Tatumella terrea]|uniref:DUF2919 domain-containing protein n=1 Tax=Tatumella terrea TaxID=419007 RepID=UPI00338AA000